MSGQAGGRGYLIQAVIAVLDALNDHEWTECVLEPNVGDDKVDLLFRSTNGDRVSQIKSSENAIGLTQARSWAESLEAAYPGAKHYELRLIGPVTSGVTAKTRVGNVEIPVPETLNIRSLLEQCAHRLDQYLRALNCGATRPKARELLAEALATRLGTLSAKGEAISREALAVLLGDWVAELFSPDADEIAVPHQLPGAPGDFVGRHDEIAVLRQTVEQGNIRVILIRGMTGVGKSALAAHVVAEWDHRYPDGQVYMEIRDADFGQRPTARLLTEVIQAFRPTYPTSGNVDRCCADYRTLLKGRRILLLVENVDEAGQVEQLVPPTAGSVLIVTTQTRFDLPGALTIDLDVLPEEDGTLLVKSIAPRVSDVARLLARICGYLPLAIRIAAGTLNARPDVSPDDFIVRLGGVKERAMLVRAALDVSLSHASDETRHFLLAASVFSIDFDAAGVSAVWGESRETTDTQIATIIGRHLLSWDDNRQRYSFHNLVHSYIAALADSRQLGLFATRHAYYYADLCSHIDDLCRAGGESVLCALDLFDIESPNIASGFYFCSEYAAIETSAAETCTKFVRGLTHIMDLRLPLFVRAQILLSGLGAAKKLGVTGLEVLHTGNLGRVYRELGELDKAIECHQWVLKMARAEGHREDQALAHHHIGLALLDKREVTAAVDQLEKALEISRDPSLKMRVLEANTLGNLGVAYLKMDRPAKAKEYLMLALELQREVNNPRTLAQTLVNCGTVLVMTDNEPVFAIELLENALGIAEELDDVQTQLAARQKLAEALGQAGRLAEALATANEQREEAAKAGFYEFETDAMQTIGDLHLVDGSVSLARASYEELLQVARDGNDQATERVAVGALAKLALHQGDKGGAVELYEQQLTLALSLRDKAITSGKLAMLALEQGDRSKAVKLLRGALEYYVSVNHEVVEDLKIQIREIDDEAAN